MRIGILRGVLAALTANQSFRQRGAQNPVRDSGFHIAIGGDAGNRPPATGVRVAVPRKGLACVSGGSSLLSRRQSRRASESRALSTRRHPGFPIDTKTTSLTRGSAPSSIANNMASALIFKASIKAAPITSPSTTALDPALCSTRGETTCLDPVEPVGSRW